MKLAVVVPALDEEQSIGRVVGSIDRNLVDEIVVGDNASRDRTREVAESAGARVVTASERGYGAACAAAVGALSESIGIVVFMDGDGADEPNDLPRLIEPIVKGEADLVIGVRTAALRERGSLTAQQILGNWIATSLIRLLLGHRYTDLGPFRAVRRSLLDAMEMKDRRYGWTVEMQIRALQLGAKVAEVPVSYRRRAGKSKISGTVRGVVLAGYWILSTIFRLALTHPARGRSELRAWK